MSIQIIEVEIPVAGITEITVQFGGGGGGGVTDHGALTGLGDDDHPQYAKSDGTRGAFAAPLGTDDNYVTDAEKVKLANTSGLNTGDQTSVTGNAGTVTTINGLITQGTNVTLTGAGTAASPYNIAAAAPVDAITDGNLSAVTSNAVFDGLALKAPLASPTFTGNLATSFGNITTTYANISTSEPGGSVTLASTGVITASGNITAGTGITSTTGDITASNGQFIGAGTGLTGTAAGLTSGTVSTINGLIAAGTNVTLTGAGTGASPYTIASGGATRYSSAGATTLTTSQSGSMIVNAGGPRTYTIPAGAAGLIYSFKCETVSTLTVKTGTAELIKHGTLTTVATTGALTSSTAGAIITVAWDGTYWQTTAATHNWLVDGVALADLPAGNLSGDIAVARIATALTAPGPIGGTTPAAITGTTGTFSGAVNVTDATAATSATTGALKVTGGISSQGAVVAGGFVWAGASSGFYQNGRAYLKAPSDGVWTVLNSTESGFNRLQMGGTSASFPALKRNLTAINIRLADDSADAPLTCSNLTASGTLAITGDVLFGKTITGSGTTGNVTINKTSGSARFPAASAAGLVVTNSLCTVNSVILCTIGSNDTTCKAAQVVAGAGSFTIYPGATTTSECIVYFSITN